MGAASRGGATGIPQIMAVGATGRSHDAYTIGARRGAEAGPWHHVNFST